MRRNRITKIDNRGKNRLLAYFSLCFILLLLLVVRIGYLQFVQGSELKESAIKNQLSSKTISPSRGTIYDSTGKALAASARVDTVSINPTRVQYSDGTEVNKEVLAHAFSKIFKVDYEELLENLNTKTSTFIVAKKVENDKIDKLKKWMKENKVTSGISIDEDVKRYYPYNNLASNLIGFTGAENSGLAGLEATLDDVLSRNSWKNTYINRLYKWGNTRCRANICGSTKW